MKLSRFLFLAIHILRKKIISFKEIPQKFVEQRRIFGFMLFDINKALIDLTGWNAVSL